MRRKCRSSRAGSISGSFGSKRERAEGELRDRFERDRVLDGAAGIGTPRERPVGTDEGGRHLEWVEPPRLDRLDDHLTRVRFVGPADLRRGQGARHGNRPVEMIGMGRAVAGELEPGLGPCGREGRMRVDDSADGFETAVEHEVGRCVGGGLEAAVDHLAARELDEDDRLGVELVVGHAARLDRHHPGVAIDLARVAEGERDEARLDDREVRVEDALAELDVVHDRRRYSPCARR